MDKPQSIQPDAVHKDAETAYRQFIKQILRHSGGLQSESEHGKIFSFETYLREKGISAELVSAYCTHLKTSDFAEKFAAETNKPGRIYLNNIRVLLTFFLISWVPGILLYLLVAAFLFTFAISIWSYKPFLYFALSGPVLAAVVLIPQYMRAKKQKRSGTKSPPYVIRYFDNDELSFAKSKSRLFVEK
ncbi:hypothetical protein [Longitalea arenae]|uniref:hypothetical protein n=1 Tax=Longitalea arenae TaxID=2812558 RepID=UPI001967D0E9|nr:hypothetical protein [Longitalea arenae]